MFRTLRELGVGDPSSRAHGKSLGRVNIEELQFYVLRFFIRHIEELEDDQIKEDNTNPNFILEKDMHFPLKPHNLN